MSAAARFGQRLRDARLRRNITAAQLASETHIPLGHLEALEAGLLQAIPAGLYRRAEVRAYAEAVGLDAAQILAELRQVVESNDGTSHRPPAGNAPRGDGVTDAVPPAPAPIAAAAGARDVARDLPAHELRDHEAVPAAQTYRAGRGAAATRRRAPRDPRRRWRLAAVLVLGAGGLLWEQSRGAPSQQAPPVARELASFADITLPLDVAADAIAGVTRRAEATDAAPVFSRALLRSPSGEARRRPQLASGRLVVQSTPPGARVTVNGVGWGETPVSIRYLPFGTLRVRLVKETHRAVDRVVELTPEVPTSTLRVSLQSTRPASRAPARAAGPMLRVTTTPEGARVTVNGIGWGTTPIEIPHLAPGVQRVRVVQAGYVSEERIVNVGDGEPRRVSIAMKPLS